MEQFIPRYMTQCHHQTGPSFDRTMPSVAAVWILNTCKAESYSTMYVCPWPWCGGDLGAHVRPLGTPRMDVVGWELGVLLILNTSTIPTDGFHFASLSVSTLRQMVCLDCCCLLLGPIDQLQHLLHERRKKRNLEGEKRARVFGAILASRTHLDLLQQVPPSLFAADSIDNRELHVGLCISPRTSLKKNSSGFMNHSIERMSNSQDFVHFYA